jgi:cation transport ATPase
MPTRKQRRRDLKSKRHEYEFVYVDSEGNEVDEPEEADAPAQPKQTSTANGSKPKQSTGKKQAAQTSRPRREPQAPSWKRAAKRSALLGVFVMIFFSFTAKGNLIRVLPTAILFSVAYVPVMYYIDRMAYRRFQGRAAAKAATTKSPAAKKR